MVVLSLFDGMSCAQIALIEAGYKDFTYYASEVEKYPIQCTQHNFPNTIQLGDVRNVDVSKLKPITHLFGGSPCQSFSFAGKRKGMSTKCNLEIYTLDKYMELKAEGFEFEGQSYLFWEYIRILTEIRKYNPDVIFLLENVEMGKKWERILSEAIGIYGVHINSALVSAQNRKRIYWTNIKTIKNGLFGDLYSDIPQPKDEGILLKDILESEVDDRYYLSERSLNGMVQHRLRHENKNNGFGYDILDIGDKSNTILQRHYKDGKDCLVNHSDIDLIVHNLMPRSSKTGKVGTGPLSRNDGKTYCLDTGNTNAIEYNYRQDTPIKENSRKFQCLRANAGGVGKGVSLELNTSKIRRLTPTECKRLQTVPDWYDMTILSDTQQYKALGNGWTIKVIVHILSFLK